MQIIIRNLLEILTVEQCVYDMRSMVAWWRALIHGAYRRDREGWDRLLSACLIGLQVEVVRINGGVCRPVVVTDRSLVCRQQATIYEQDRSAAAAAAETGVQSSAGRNPR